MVSEDEKKGVDVLGLVTNRTRSATLAKIVTLFLESTSGEKTAQDDAKGRLDKYIDECREKFSNRSKPIKSKGKK
ncbi:hypothetical protein VDG1235_1373 [Verrucomicrobiia bacterium DG1235]|nr:hypothetical protein VDG1235_1373 [Verrucomicrobiae bacterium DG1235]